MTQKRVSIRDSLKIIYYLMAVDGEISPSELQKFDEIGKELDVTFEQDKENIIKECKQQLEKVIDEDEYYEVIKEGVEDSIRVESDDNVLQNWALEMSTNGKSVNKKLLIWNLLSIASCDEDFSENERKLIKFTYRKLDIDKAVFLEMENSIKAIAAIDAEEKMLKLSQKPYMIIENFVNELANRRNVIMNGVKELISE